MLANRGRELLIRDTDWLLAFPFFACWKMWRLRALDLSVGFGEYWKPSCFSFVYLTQGSLCLILFAFFLFLARWIKWISLYDNWNVAYWFGHRWRGASVVFGIEIYMSNKDYYCLSTTIDQYVYLDRKTKIIHLNRTDSHGEFGWLLILLNLGSFSFPISAQLPSLLSLTTTPTFTSRLFNLHCSPNFQNNYTWKPRNYVYSVNPNHFQIEGQNGNKDLQEVHQSRKN